MPIITVASFVIGIHYGIEGVATAYTAATYLILVPSLFYCFDKTPITVTIFFRALAPSIFISIIAAMALLSLKLGYHRDGFLGHFLYTALFAFVYCGLTLCRKTIRVNCILACKSLPFIKRFGTNVSFFDLIKVKRRP